MYSLTPVNAMNLRLLTACILINMCVLTHMYFGIDFKNQVTSNSSSLTYAMGSIYLARLSVGKRHGAVFFAIALGLSSLYIFFLLLCGDLVRLSYSPAVIIAAFVVFGLLQTTIQYICVTLLQDYYAGAE